MAALVGAAKAAHLARIHHNARLVGTKVRAIAAKTRHPFEERVVSGFAGLALAFAESKMPLAILGIPVKAWLTVGATAVELNSKGRMKEIAGAMGDVAAGVYGYQAFKAKTLVAGNGTE